MASKRVVESDLNLIGAALRSLAEDKEKKSTPVDIQCSLLGLGPQLIDGLRGEKVLDVGCGKEGALVSYLRSKGVEAEGLDLEAPEGHAHFIKARVKVPGELEGIPRPDGHYSLMVSFQNTLFNDSFGIDATPSVSALLGEPNEQEKAYLLASRREAALLVGEMSRTLRPEGRIVVFPYLFGLVNVLGPSLRELQLVLDKQRVSGTLVERWLSYEAPHMAITDEKVELGSYRNVLRKTQS